MLMYAHKVLWNFSAKCAELVLNLTSLEKKLLCPKKCELPQSLFISKLLKISCPIETRLMQLFFIFKGLNNFDWTLHSLFSKVCKYRPINALWKIYFSKCVFCNASANLSHFKKNTNFQSALLNPFLFIIFFNFSSY